MGLQRREKPRPDSLKKCCRFSKPVFVITTSSLFVKGRIPHFQRRRLMKTRIAFALVEIVLLTVTTSLRAEEKAASVSARRLEALKQMAGDWVEVGKDGKPTDKIVSSIRVTSAGTAVLETLFPGTNHEMVTMYHLDGDD